MPRTLPHGAALDARDRGYSTLSSDRSPSRTSTARDLARFGGRFAAVTLSVGILALHAYFVVVNEWWILGGDAEAYYLAAQRILDGEALYISDLNQAQLYRYAPWLAWLFVPLTVLPREAVIAGMSVASLVAAAAVLWPLRRPSYETLAILLLIGPALVHSAFLGNVQALLVAAVMYLPARGVWIGIAASLKGAPLALAFAEERRDLYVAVAVGAVLLAPMLTHDLRDYPTQHGVGLWAVSPALSAVVGVIGSALAYLSRSRLIAAATVVLASPYFLLSYLAWLLVPVAVGAGRRPSARAGDTARPYRRR